jgi:SAM-dependent methyltransferase
MRFEDHFSIHAREYARYRPEYPDELFQYLASISPECELAWDCGTGNGQAAIGLIRYFARVVATDASAEQIAQAHQHDRITYQVARADQVALRTACVDLVTAAVAVHWFDLEAFYAEVRRVLMPGGVLAVWTYHLPSIASEIDQLLHHYYVNVVGHYWPDRMHYLHERYQTLPFPFDELSPPAFPMRTAWDLSQLAGFLDSWSATRRYIQAQGHHPVGQIWDALLRAWGEPEQKRNLDWPLFIRVGRALC